MTDENPDHGTLVFTCPACGRDFTELNEACPACNAPIDDLPLITYTPPKSPLFKAIAWFILIAFIAFMTAVILLAIFPR